MREQFEAITTDYTVVDVDAHFPETIGNLDTDNPWKERLEETSDKPPPNNTPDHYRYG